MFSANRHHAELTPNNFTVGVGLQLALNFVPNLFLRVELNDIDGRVVVSMNEDSVTDIGSSRHLERLKLGLTEKSLNGENDEREDV